MLSSYVFHMSDSKWVKLFELLHTLKSRFPLLERCAVIIKRRYIGSKEIYSTWQSLPDPKKHIACYNNKYYFPDGAVGACGNSTFNELFEIHLPIYEKKVVYHKLTPPEVKEELLFPEYEQFLQELDRHAKFPYRIEQSYTQADERTAPTELRPLIFYRSIVFFGYSSLNSDS